MFDGYQQAAGRRAVYLFGGVERPRVTINGNVIFKSVSYLFGSLALAIPVLIHLVRREKSEIIPFSSLMFLLKVPKRSIRQQKMKNLLLMALRLLILALLVGAFARPYMTQPAKPAANANSNRGVVMMLDTSYSMQYGRQLQQVEGGSPKANRRAASRRSHGDRRVQ